MKKKSLKFSTSPDPWKSKTKCIIFSQKTVNTSTVRPIELDGKSLPWVSQIKHLGNILDQANNFKQDLAIKKGQFIAKVNSILQEFYYLSYATIVQLINIYAISFHGSCLWDLYSNECDRLYKSLNVAMRHVYKVPNTTHKYLIEDLSDTHHLKAILNSRYVGFCKSLLGSPKYIVRLLGSLNLTDLRTKMGKTKSKILSECGLKNLTDSKLTSRMVRNETKYMNVPTEEKWRIGIMKGLVKREIFVPGFSQQEMEDMLQVICSS